MTAQEEACGQRLLGRCDALDHALRAVHAEEWGASEGQAEILRILKEMRCEAQEALDLWKRVYDIPT